MDWYLFSGEIATLLAQQCWEALPEVEGTFLLEEGKGMDIMEIGTKFKVLSAGLVAIRGGM